MENNRIDVPGAQEFARPTNRRDFFKSLAVAGAGATAASLLVSKRASAQSSDVDIANFALTLEYLEADFYAMAVDSGVLSGDALGVVENLASHEAQHVTALTDLLERVGATAYLGAAPLISSPDILAAAGSIAGVEGEHVVAVNWLLGVVPYANEAFPKALTLDEVSAAVAPFMGGQMMSTGGPKLSPVAGYPRGPL